MHLYPMKRILVCTDLTPESDVVLKAADTLCRKHEGTLDILYVSDMGLHIDEVIKDTFKEVFLKDLRTSIETKMKAQMERLQISGNILIKSGGVAEGIVNLADQGNHDLVMMGHGRKHFMEKILGSNAAKVVSTCTVPLLVIKKNPDFKKIGCLIDESRPMDKLIIGAFNYMKNFGYEEAEFLSLWIDFPKPFGISEEGHLVQDKVSREVEYFAPQNVKYVVKTSPTRELKLGDALEKILVSDGVDTAVVKRFSEGNLKRVYIGSTTRRILENFAGNILVIPP